MVPESSVATRRPFAPFCVRNDLRAHKQVNGNRLNEAGIISACGNMKFEEFCWTCHTVSRLGTKAVRQSGKGSGLHHNPSYWCRKKRLNHRLNEWPDLDLQLSTFMAGGRRARLHPGADVRPLQRRWGKRRRGGGGWMGRGAEQHSKYITNVPAAVSGVPAHLLSPQSSLDDLCISYQSQRHLNWVETAGEEGGSGGVPSASLSPSAFDGTTAGAPLSRRLNGRTLRAAGQIYLERLCSRMHQRKAHLLSEIFQLSVL